MQREKERERERERFITSMEPIPAYEDRAIVNFGPVLQWPYTESGQECAGGHVNIWIRSKGPMEGSRSSQPESKPTARADKIKKASGNKHPHDQPNGANFASTRSFCHLAAAASYGPSSCAGHLTVQQDDC